MTPSTLFLSSFVMAFSGAMMPGPLLTVNIDETYRRGFWAGPLLILGHGILEAGLVIGLSLGLAAFLIQPIFKGGVALIGGLVLLWMGWGMFRDACYDRVSLEINRSGDHKRMPPVIAGIIVSLSNPYWLLWWATIGLTYITIAGQLGTFGLVVFLTGHVLADLLWYSAISLAVVSGKKFLDVKVYRAILIICGIFLFGLALYFVWSGWTFIHN